MIFDDIDEKSVNAKVRKWCGRIELARKREKHWRAEARKIIEIYEGARPESTPFNILFSNTETLAPALYSRLPRPVVERRFRDKDALGRATAQALKRGLEFSMDSGVEGEYQPFHESIRDSVLDALLPGRGGIRLRYSAYVEEEEGSAPSGEKVCFESIEYDRVYFGYAKKWCDVPWVAFESYLDKAAMEKEFGKAVAEDTKYSAQEEKEGEGKSGEERKTDEKTALVYEVWEKRSRSIIWLSPDYGKELLRVDEDELGLDGFYPMPPPLRLLRKSNNLAPTALYKQYENQAKELNKLTVRLNRLIEACKVRGVYNGMVVEIEQVLKQDDNGLVPAQNVQGLENGGLEKNIWLLPLEKIQQTIAQLYEARERCKQVIYEITGISDILRGSTKASETLGAQKIKESWGTMRLKRMQGEVQEYVRECLRLTAEIMAKHFSEETWAEMTQMQLPTSQDLAAAQQMIEAGRQLQAIGLPPPPDIQQAQQMLAAPSWPAVLQVLRNDLSRQYRVDIETNSTIEPEAAEDKEHIAEITNAMSQFLNGVAPMVESGIMDFEIAKFMLLAIVRRFRFGTELEDALEQMRPPEPKADPNAQAKAEIEKQKLENSREEHQMDLEGRKMEMEFKREEHRLRMLELQAKVLAQRELNDLKADALRMKGSMDSAQGEQRLELGQMQGEQRLQQAQQAGELRAARRGKGRRGKENARV